MHMIRDAARFLICSWVVLSGVAIGYFVILVGGLNTEVPDSTLFDWPEPRRLLVLAKAKKSGRIDADSGFVHHYSVLHAFTSVFFHLLDGGQPWQDLIELSEEQGSAWPWGAIMLAMFSGVAFLILVNLLIAQMASTYSAIEENSEVHWRRALARYVFTVEQKLKRL